MPTLIEHRQHVEELLDQNRIEEARDYCRRMSHPNSRLWLSQINRLFPIEHEAETPIDSGLQFDGEIDERILAKLLFFEEDEAGEVYLSDKVKNTLPTWRERIEVFKFPLFMLTVLLIVGAVFILSNFFWREVGLLLLYGPLLFGGWFVLHWIRSTVQNTINPPKKQIIAPEDVSKRRPIDYPISRRFVEDAIREYGEPKGHYSPPRPYRRLEHREEWRETSIVKRSTNYARRNRQDIQFLLGFEVAPFTAMLGLIGVVPTFMYLLTVVLVLQGIYSIIENNRENRRV